MMPDCSDVPFFLIAASTPIVAADIAEAIRIAHPGPCRIDAVRDVTAAAAWVAGCERLAAAFLVASEEVILATGLAAAVDRRGGRIVVVSGTLPPVRAEFHGWELLAEPFTGDMVESIIRTVMGARAG